MEKVHQIALFIGENLKKHSGDGIVPPPQTPRHHSDHTPSPRRLDPHTFGVTACPSYLQILATPPSLCRSGAGWRDA